MRYALELAYNGANYAGWQRQPNALTVEEVVDTALSTILGEPIKIIGCGRTDAGVHATDYVAHFDFDGTVPPAFKRRYNRFVADDVALRGLHRVPGDFHARFSATARSYTYRMTLEKDPFRPTTVTSLPQFAGADQQLMQRAARLLLEYKAFAPFCKANSDAHTMNCDLRRAEWVFDDHEWTFHVDADRFLRGMIRLVVGMCLRVGTGKVKLEDVKAALATQTALRQPWSAPAAGLFLSSVTYAGRFDWQNVG
ncbi:tRNA pseudouridine(38-40) synthase TruA [Neolewinella antarctica]|uniref:tRNA pseudouridine synthase A n=1 Tax=Neolewinella antarctica TaxID=442734 RepID=A0ABX0XFZ6_9BACT|nr:tRNA pseudouridine(38-40) synthase TruA [Neolewinella antarctica]NJC27801.1 tRNA pseudouridine38-40 synthase [Neolewinella antarctica]